MKDSKKPIEPSPLVKAVLALDNYFSELDRVGGKINSMELKTDFDFEHAQRLMTRFAECGQGIGDEVAALSTQLNEARSRSELTAAGVSAKAELIMARKTAQQKRMDEFHQLGEKVKLINSAVSQLRRPEGQAYSNEERAEVAVALSQIEGQLGPLIEQAQAMRKDAQDSKMKVLEQNADSLTQTLQTIRGKLGNLNFVAH
jgi:oligoendopeptidase F